MEAITQKICSGMKGTILAGFVVCSGVPSGCIATNQRSLMLAKLDPDSPVSVAAFHEATLPPEHKDYALRELMRAQAFLDAGDYLDADTCLSNACEVMDRIVGDEDRERLAVAWTESSKVFKGQPYERALAWFYRGICRYQMQDYTGALACFRHSLACDQETRSDKQKDLEDFAISHFMAARAYYRLGERSNAEASLAAARRYTPDTPYLSVDGLSANCVVIIGTGTGPFIRPSAIDVSIARVDCSESPDARVRVSVDGQHLGEATMITDMLVQAKSQGWGEMDRVRLAKSVGRRIISYVPFGGLAANLIRPEVDMRCWYNVPRLFHVFVGNVSPGLHGVSIDVRDAAGQPQPRYGQTWYHVPFSPEGETLLFLRSVRNAQNHYELIPVGLSGREIGPAAVAGDTVELGAGEQR